MAWIIGDAMLALRLDASEAEKETLYIRLVQWGIDLYGDDRQEARRFDRAQRDRRELKTHRSMAA